MGFTSDTKGPGGLKKLNCILIAEDNEHDAKSLRSAFEAAGVNANFVIVSTYQEVRNYFEKAKTEKDASCPFPNIFFLDPKLADGDRLEELKEIKQAAGKPFVTVVVSGRSDVAYIRRLYELGANTYFPKPVRPVDILNFLTFQGFGFSL